MCRIAFFPPGVADVFTRPQLVEYLEELQTAQGGDGNGFYFFQTDQIAKSYQQYTINRLIKFGPWKGGFLFHTRKATNGNKCDRNCHPFRLGPHQAIVHNGVWTGYDMMEPFVKCISDTDSERMGWWCKATKYSKTPSGAGSIFVAHRRGDTNFVLLHRSTTSDMVCCKKGSYAWLASVAPKDKTLYDESYEIADGGYYIPATAAGICWLKKATYQRYQYNTYEYDKTYNKKKDSGEWYWEH